MGSLLFLIQIKKILLILTPFLLSGQIVVAGKVDRELLPWLNFTVRLFLLIVYVFMLLLNFSFCVHQRCSLFSNLLASYDFCLHSICYLGSVNLHASVDAFIVAVTFVVV